ncbi:hypothetical protein [Rhizobium acidisoli]|nr:hypothetical protein [Rhizobium acidisoli]
MNWTRGAVSAHELEPGSHPCCLTGRRAEAPITGTPIAGEPAYFGKDDRSFSSPMEERDMQTTRSKELANEYLRLGGKRLAKIDDNIVKIRHWEDDTPEAEAFWQKNIEPLDERRRVEVETHLPTINDR